MYIYGAVGPWTGCGYNTIRVLFPLPTILGYDACVPPIIQGSGPVIIVP